MDSAISFHQSASIFTMLEIDSDDFRALVDSIRKHGLRESIKTHDGQILDGRNRMTACTMAGIAPRFEEANVNGSIADYVFDMNFHRRQLTVGAKAIAAARYKEVATEEAAARKKATEGRPKKGQEKPVAIVPPVSRARDVAGKKFGVSGKTTDASERILKKGSDELIKAVESGAVKVSTAARLAEAPRDVQSAAVREGNAAVRAAIEKHTPSLSEEARNDAGVRWSKSMREIRTNLCSTRDLGGIEELTARWTPELTEQYRDDISEIIQELEQWKKALTAKLRKR